MRSVPSNEHWVQCGDAVWRRNVVVVVNVHPFFAAVGRQASVVRANMARTTVVMRVIVGRARSALVAILQSVLSISCWAAGPKECSGEGRPSLDSLRFSNSIRSGLVGIKPCSLHTVRRSRQQGTGIILHLGRHDTHYQFVRSEETADSYQFV